MPPADYAIYDPRTDLSPPVVGLVVARGLADDDEGRSYLVVDGIDGRLHYVDIGIDDGGVGPLGRDAIVRILPAVVEAREVDCTVSEIAQANGGFYSEELHALHDRAASEPFIAAHVRRLEALRRMSRAAERGADGVWRIAPDHLERALAHDRDRAQAGPVAIEVLASVPLGQLARYEGITALDEDPDLRSRERLGSGFGRKVADALRRRRQWLAAQGLAERPDALEVLRRRELVRVAARLSQELGLGFVENGDGSRVQGTYRQSVRVGALRMAVIEDGRGFALVPWRRALERQLGREVSGLMRGNDINWTFGRPRGRGLDR